MRNYLRDMIVAMADACIEFVYDLPVSDAVTVDIAGRSVRIALKQRLLTMKRQVQPARPKDLWDIAELEKLGTEP